MSGAADVVPEYPVAPPQRAAPDAVPRSGFPPLVWVVLGVVLAKGFDLVGARRRQCLKTICGVTHGCSAVRITSPESLRRC